MLLQRRLERFLGMLCQCKKCHAKLAACLFLPKQGFAKISQQAKWAQDCQQQIFNKVCPEIAKAVLFPPLCWEALAMEPP